MSFWIALAVGIGALVFHTTCGIIAALIAGVSVVGIGALCCIAGRSDRR